MADMSAYRSFSEIQQGETCERPVLLLSIANASTRYGDTYVKTTLRDGKSEIKANMFKTSAEKLAELGVVKSSVCDAVLTRTEKGFNLDKLSPAKDISLTKNDFAKCAPLDLDMMYNEICELLKSAADDCGGSCKPLSELALSILEKEQKGYMFSSASLTMHHNMVGGLLYHSYRMVKAADALCTVYTELDRELLLCGAALHDIGKMWEYRTHDTGDSEYTANGVLFGHIYMGASLIKSYTEGEDYNMKKIHQLIHLILSHHGTREWGAVVCPATAEAFVLHYIDNIDAKVYMCNDNYENLKPGEFTERAPFGLDNRVFRPDK